MSLNLQESSSKALQEFGESLTTAEGRIACFKKYGYAVYKEALGWYHFYQTEHIVPEKMKLELEKYREDHKGIATSSTPLSF